MNSRRIKQLAVVIVVVLAMLAVTAPAMAQEAGADPGAPATTGANWLQQMQEWTGPEAWGQMIQVMTQVHGAEATGQMLQQMSQNGGCHGVDGDDQGFSGMMQGNFHGFGAMMGGAGR